MNAETKLTVADFLAENKPAARRSVYWDYLDEIIELAEAGASGNQICDYIRKTGEQRNVCQPNLFAFIRRLASKSGPNDSESLINMITKIKRAHVVKSGNVVSATNPTSSGVRSQAASPVTVSPSPLAHDDHNSARIKKAQERAQKEAEADKNRVRTGFFKPEDFSADEFEAMWVAWTERSGEKRHSSVTDFGREYFTNYPAASGKTSSI